jgi:hypothetical protein
MTRLVCSAVEEPSIVSLLRACARHPPALPTEMRNPVRLLSSLTDPVLVPAALVLAITACKSSEDRANSTRPPQSESAAAMSPRESPRGIPGVASTSPIQGTSSATDTVISRARDLMHTELPMFREWTDSLAAPLSLTEAGPAAFSIGPVLGDFDEDGAPDVAFVGHDAQGEQVIVVLSHRGHAAVVRVDGEDSASEAGAQHRRWIRLATIFTDRDQVGLESVTRNERNTFDLPPSQYVYRKGHFMQWIEGN